MDDASGTGDAGRKAELLSHGEIGKLDPLFVQGSKAAACPMTDLKSKRWIVAKGVMFLAIAVITAALILSEAPSLQRAALLALLVWASCRFYYFLFYVLEHYVDPTMRYAGLLDLLMGMKRRRQGMRRDV
jgi:hypothetical protein